jgi:very-short-patch-repair endonuclease
MRRLSALPARLIDLASTCHGAVLVAELERAGFDGRARRRQIAAGALHPIARGVCAIPGLSDRLTVAAGLQLLHPSTVAERTSAAAVWGLDGFDGALGSPVTLQVPRVERLRRRGVVGRSATLPERAITEHEGIRVTTPTWTLGELGAVPGVDADMVELAVESALRMGLTTDAKLRRVLEARSGRRWPGTAVLAEALGRRRPGEPATDSYAETRFLQVVVRPLRVEDPHRQVTILPPGRLRPYRCDFLFDRRRRLDVEVDGEMHAPAAARDHDSDRDRHIRASGCEVVRFSASRIERRPMTVRAMLLRDLAAVS